MEDTNEYFNMALARFVKNFACGDEIRAKYKNGKSVKQIKDELTFPVSEEYIEKVIKEYNENGGK